MTLTGKQYIWWSYGYRNVEGKIDISIGWKKLDIDLKKVSYIELDIAHWRKANQIHKRFVYNVQWYNDDWHDYYVSVEELESLLSVCKKVLKSLEWQKLIKRTVKDKYSKDKSYEMEVYENDKIALELLPPQEWFFFWNYNVDKYYKEDLEITIEQLENLDPDLDYYYNASR